MAAIDQAAAHDLNEELTVILSAAAAAIRLTPLHHPARRHLVEIRDAAMRAASRSSRLLSHAARNGARPSSATLERMTETK